MIIILDTTILTLLTTTSRGSQEAKECVEWFFKLLARGVSFNLPEICDYEVRRGILLLEKKTGKSQDKTLRLEKLNTIREYCEGLAFTSTISEIAAEFWAESTSKGKTQPKGVSADILILAHAKSKQDEFPGRRIIIATKNIDDFTIFKTKYPTILALNWSEINY